MPCGVYIRTEEIRQRNRVANEGHAVSMHTRQLLREAAIGKKRGPHSPETIAKMVAFQNTPEQLERNREAHAGKKNPNLQGDKNGMWKGGITPIHYPSEFTEELKESIRERDGHICQYPECGKTEEENNGRKLSVHHVDYNKQNCADDNLISLCCVCHRKIELNREYCKQLFQQLVLV